MDANKEPLLSQAERDAIAAIAHGIVPLSLSDIQQLQGMPCRIYFDNGESVTCTTDDVTRYVSGYVGLHGRWFVLPTSVDIQEEAKEFFWKL